MRLACIRVRRIAACSASRDESQRAISQVAVPLAIKTKGRSAVPKYLGQGSYKTEGWKGLQKESATSRRDAIAKMLASVGGKLENFYFAFGEHDFIWIADFPDNITAAAVAVSVAASGMVKSQATPLLTVEDMDAALKKSVAYRPPGR
jgi:uncharacterized protein with GYD domain